MKSEKEIKWLVFLYSSSYCKDMLNFKLSTESGCLTDFEKVIGVGRNNWEFRKWFKNLIKDEVFIYTGKIYKGNRNNVVSDGYIVNAKNLFKYAKNNPLHDKMWKFYNRDRVI